MAKASNPELSNHQIADRLGCTYNALQLMLWKATKLGLLTFDSPLEKFKYQTLPKVVDGLDGLVEAKDKQAIIETAKATIFKQYVAEEGITEQPSLVLGLKIEMTPSDAKNIPAGSQIIGTGRSVQKTLDGQVAEQE